MFKSFLQRIVGNSGDHPLSKAPAPASDHPDWIVNQIMSASTAEAQRLHHPAVQSDHVLLALIKTQIGVAHKVLRELGIESSAVENLLPTKSPEDVPLPEKPEVSDEVKAILAKATDEAQYFKRKRISSEHILLALLHFDSTSAYQILQQLNITPKTLREKTYFLVDCETKMDAPSDQPDSRKMERFTIRARHVLSLSQQVAEERHDNNIGTEYILIALLREGGGMAWRALIELGITANKLEPILYSLMNPPDSKPNEMRLSKDAKQTLEYAVDEARRRNLNYIGTEHLLLAITHQKKSLALEALKRLGITPEMVKNKIKSILAAESI